MAKHTLTAIYQFKYRFQCEHCGQTTEWKSGHFQEETTYKSSVFERKEVRQEIQKQFNKEFMKKIPALIKRLMRVIMNFHTADSTAIFRTVKSASRGKKQQVSDGFSSE